MNIMYIGSSGAMSLVPFKFLLDTDHQLCGVGVDAHKDAFLRDTRISIVSAMNETIEMLARVAGVPVIDLYAPLAQCVAAIREAAPDLILVSCFGRKLPDEILSIPTLGCFNLHPSKLPAYRGPVPGFWQFHDGVETFGVSLHRMIDRMDAGAIAAQRDLSMPDGISNAEASERVAQAYLELLPGFLRDIADGSLIETPQDKSVASYQGYPEAQDFGVSTSWPARRIFNFMCATQHWGAFYPCEIDFELIELATAERYDPNARLAVDVERKGELVKLQCQPGVLWARLA
jgi:methionyl-tRNA formyltransferase